MVLQWLYVDNGAFPFESQDQLKRGVQVINDKIFSLWTWNARWKINRREDQDIQDRMSIFLTPQLFEQKIPYWNKYIKEENVKYLLTEGSL